jgi:hypothetical protein
MGRGSLPPLEDDFSRALLGSAEADAPSKTAYAKVAAALGVGVGLGVGASLPAPAVLALGTAGVTGVARWSSSLGAKLLALGASGALIVGAGALLLRKSQESETAASQRGKVMRVEPAARGAIVPARPAPGAARPERSLPLSPSVSSPGAGSAAAAPAGQASPSPVIRSFAGPLPARRSTRVGPASAASAMSARPTGSSSLAEQVQSLDRARVALGAGESSAALREIARYRATWPDGVFLTEASVLEIEALAVQGERKQAAARAAEFVAAHPDSPQADRLRGLIPIKKR